MKAFQVLNAQPILIRLSKADLPLKTSVELSRHFRAAFEIHKLIVERREALYMKYGEHIPDKDQTVILDENKEIFCEEYTKLMQDELTWELPPIDLEPFDKAGFTLSVEDAAKIEWFVS